MARPSATAAFLLLLLAVAHALEADPATDAEPTAVVAVGDDETGPPNPAEAGATEVVVPEELGLLHLPSHRRHRHHPCHQGLGLPHRHLWWARHHGIFRDAHRSHRHGDAQITELDREGEPREAVDEAKPVAEPDPDRSLPDSDGEGELSMKPFRDGGEDEDASVKQWKEMLWRRFHFHHGLRRHGRHHHRNHAEEQDHEHEHELAEEGASRGVKRFQQYDEEDEDDEEKKMRTRFHHRRHGDEEEEERKMRKRFRRADGDSDDEDDEVEEMVRRLRKAVLRRRSGSGHGRRFHHHHGLRHAEYADEKADGEEEGGVMAWIKGLMNRF